MDDMSQDNDYRAHTAPKCTTSKDRLSRPKAQLSCDLCRKKKIKCDRERPCRNCSRLPPGSCIYPRATWITNGRPKKAGNTADSRLDRLEKLLASITDAQNATQPSTPGQEVVETDQILDSPPRLQIRNDSPMFLTGSHWEMVLNEIADINSELLAEQRDSDVPSDQGRPHLLANDRSNVSVSELVCSVPSRQSVEAMVDICTSDPSLATLLVIVHVPTFMRECERFRKDSETFSLTWLAKVYAIMALAVQTALRREITIPDIILPETAAKVYTLRAADCLIKSDYTRPKQGTIEAMCLYLASEHYWNLNNSFGARMVFTLITQLTYRLGYHRDPGHYLGITPFECEMRRRVWAFHRQMDLLLSEKSGLPRTIDERQADTLDPANLLDEDIDEDTTDLPPWRSESEPTTISYLNYKNKALKIQAKVTDRVNCPTQLTYADTLELDQELSAVEEAKPTWLQVVNRHKSHDIEHRDSCRAIEIDLIADRTRIILHRKYLVPARTQSCYVYSRRACLEAAKKILQHQIALSTEKANAISPKAGEWRFVSLMSHDFLLGGMIICLDVDQDLRHNAVESSTTDSFERTGKVGMLYAAHRAWEIFRAASGADQRGAALIESMIARVQRRLASQDSQPVYLQLQSDCPEQPSLPIESLPGTVSAANSNDSYPDFGRDVEITMDEILQAPYQLDYTAGGFQADGDCGREGTAMDLSWMNWNIQGVESHFSLQ